MKHIYKSLLWFAASMGSFTLSFKLLVLGLYAFGLLAFLFAFVAIIMFGIYLQLDCFEREDNANELKL